jgi:ABC-type nitrate/sulfonate/bicarbonate transport system ATPase subunit
VTEPLLRARGVAVERAGVAVVRGVDLDLRAGEVVVVIGPNGAGKSTLLASLAGLLPPAAGTIERRGRVAAVLQAPALARRPARANVEAALAWWGVPRAARRDRALAALSAIGARDLAERPAGALSGGEARRVHLARGLALAPDALLLDEPFAGLDAPTRAELLYDAASVLRDERRATLVVVHDRVEAWALADRVVVMLDGRVAADGAPAAARGRRVRRVRRPARRARRRPDAPPTGRRDRRGRGPARPGDAARARRGRRAGGARARPRAHRRDGTGPRPSPRDGGRRAPARRGHVSALKAIGGAEVIHTA